VAEAASNYAPREDMGRSLRLGLIVAGVFVFVLFILGGLVGVAGAVVAPGQLVVESSVKQIQHPTGGVVAEILVKNGQRVAANQVMLTLDPTISASNATIASEGVDKLMARQARLSAERDGRRGMTFDPALAARAGQPSAAAAMRDEAQLFRLHASERAGQKAQLAERRTQLAQEITGLQEQMAARRSEMKLIEGELVGIRKLYAKQLVPITRLNALEREAVRLQGEVGAITAAIAEARGKISEIGLQIAQIDQSAQAQAGAELNDVQARLDELRERKVTADEDLDRVRIRAPQAGVVDKLAIHTIGGVIRPGETILTVVPDSAQLTVQSRVRPTDIDQVQAGQQARVRFSAFSSRQTKELVGAVTRVAADLSVDERTGAAWYVVDIEITPEEMAKLGGLKLVPGMPAEVFIQTRKRTLLAILTKPLMDQVYRAFRTDN
jgi:HlyD family secretion protein